MRARGPITRRVLRHAVALVAALPIWLGLAGCEKQDAGPPGDVTDPTAVDRLRALPYIGSTPVEHGAGDGVVRRDAQRSAPGYNLYTVQPLSTAELIDEQGHTIRSWHLDGSARWARAELTDNGDLLVIGLDARRTPDGAPLPYDPDDARYLAWLDWDGDLLWKKQLPVHHDVEQQPDGNLLVLALRRRNVPKVHAELPTRDDLVLTLARDGTVIGTQSLLDGIAANQPAFELHRVTPDKRGGAPWVDLLHANSIEVLRDESLASRHALYKPGNILGCFRHQNQIAVFDPARNRVIWSWGADELRGPHDAQMLPSGNILLFDNGLGRGYSRAIELNPVSREIVWEYKSDPPSSFYTASKGSVQRLPNGNTLLAESDRGRAFEVTPDGEIVWEFLCPHRVAGDQRAAIVRLYRLPRARIDALIEAHDD